MSKLVNIKLKLKETKQTIERYFIRFIKQWFSKVNLF